MKLATSTLLALTFSTSLATSAGALAETAAGPAGAPLMTGFTTLVGFPSSEPAAAGGVLLVPGTVIPLGGDGAEVRRGVVERGLAFSSAVERLWSTFRLDPARQIQKGANLPARVGTALELPTVEGSAVAIAATLLGFNERAATYRVVFREGAKTVADSTVVVDRGGRAVVGGLDGPAAPYLFVFVEPEPAGVGATPSRVEKGQGLTEPVAVTKVPPAYPEEARQGRIQGVVVIEAEIDASGKVVDARILESPSPVLAGAALEAIRQWTFEPAKDATGRPIAVRFSLTMNFRLQ